MWNTCISSHLSPLAFFCSRQSNLDITNRTKSALNVSSDEKSFSSVIKQSLQSSSPLASTQRKQGSRTHTHAHTLSRCLYLPSTLVMKQTGLLLVGYISTTVLISVYYAESCLTFIQSYVVTWEHYEPQPAVCSNRATVYLVLRCRSYDRGICSVIPDTEQSCTV